MSDWFVPEEAALSAKASDESHKTAGRVRPSLLLKRRIRLDRVLLVRNLTR